MENNSQRLLAILLDHAPNRQAQEAMTNIYNNLQLKDRQHGLILEKSLAGMLYDGLAYGNWPWHGGKAIELLSRMKYGKSVTS